MALALTKQAPALEHGRYAREPGRTATTAHSIVVDDSVFFRSGIVVQLERHTPIIVDHALTLEQAYGRLKHLDVHFAVLGPSLAESETCRLCRKLASRQPAVKVLVVAFAALDPLFQTDLAAAGAGGCVAPTVDEAEFAAAVAGVTAGHRLFSLEVMTSAFGKPGLSVRERLALQLMAQRRPDREIATAMGLQPLTVRNHIQHILEKLCVHGRQEAIQRAARLGLIEAIEAQKN